MQTKTLRLKRVLRAALIFLLLGTAGVTTTMAQDFTVGNLNYNINDDGVSVTVIGHVDGTAATGVLNIPDHFTSYGNVYAVTAIGYNAFRDCSGFTGSLTIPNSVTTIGNYAFEGCRGFTGSLVIPNSVTTIGISAFSCCYRLTGELTIPNSVTTIGRYTFVNCGGFTGTLAIPNSITTIEENAFYGCSGLTSIEIPNSVTSIGDGAFYGCYDVEQIIVDADNTVYDSRNNCNAIIETSDNELIMGCKNTEIPNSVTSIRYGAFYECIGLTSIEIPNSVTSIGEGAFYRCIGVEQIIVDADNTVYDSRNNCNAIIKTSDNELIMGCKNTEIPNTVTSIGVEAFMKCMGLSSIEIPNSVTSIGDCAFYNCSALTSIEIPNSVASIGEGAFSNCYSLTSIKVFANTPPTLLGTYVFNDVNKNIPVYVPAGTISTYQATEGWSEFTYYIEPLPFSENIVFADANVKAICVTNWDANGDGELSYAEAAVVKDLRQVFSGHSITSFDELQYFNGLTTIGESAFEGCTSLTSIEIPNSATTIGESAFEGCTSLTSIEIPNSVISIGNHAFERCTSLTSIELPNSVTSIGNQAFCDCIGLTGNLIIPNSVITIGNSAFSHCENITSLTLGSSLTQIGMFAFSDMNLNYIVSNVEIPPTINVSWYSSTFNNVDKNIPVYIPCGSLSSYESADGWNSFSNFYESDYGFVVGIFEIPSIEGNASITQFPICSSNMTMTTVHAEPSWGYNFTGWYVDGNLVSTNPDYTFELMEDVILEARFERASNYFEFVGGGSDNRWDNPENWDTQELPSSTSIVGIWSNVEINTNVNVNSAKIFDGYITLTIKPNVVFTVSGTFELSDYSSLIMEEGAQVVHSNEGVRATLKKNISPFTQGLSDGWNFIATPLVGNTEITSVGNLLSNDYDLFYFDEPSCLWKNYSNPNNGFTELEAGKGYLYANSGSFFKPEGIQVGEGTSTTCDFPLNTFYDYSISENLFLATELEEAGLNTEPLGSLCWYATNAPGYEQKNISIWMANVNDEALTTTSHLTSGMTLVYTGSMTPKLGENEFVFNEDTFSWDGTSNVLVCVQRNNGAWNSRVYWQVLDPGFKATTYQYRDGSAYDMTAGTYSMSVSSSLRPKTVFQTLEQVGQCTYLPVTLSFTGEIENGSATVIVPLSYTESVGSLAGFNLVGNPFVHNVTSYGSTNVAEGCYRMNDLRDNLIVSTISNSHPLKPAEGFLVKATAEEASITFNPARGATANHNGFIYLEISENGKTIDRLIVKKEGEPLEKLSLKENSTKLYAMQGRQEMAIVSREGNEQPVSFKASKNGIYTISMEMENVELDYLHLIDNMTGADIDLLQTPEYTFAAKTTDYESRFRLLFDANENGASTGSATFACYADGEIRLVVETQDFASLQIVDVMGRVCREMLASPNHRISTAGMTPGMYVLRLIEGEDMKTQKIVVR